MPKDAWTPIAITPLSGMLDTRSRPADLAPGAFRYKLNLSINRTGALCVRSGHATFNLGPRSDTPAAVPNWDFHRRDALTPREAVTLLFEHTSVSGERRLYAGTSGILGSVSRLNNSTSEWETVGSGYPGARWKAAMLGDYVAFTSNLPGGVWFHRVSTGAWAHGIAAPSQARVVIAFSDVIFLMNVTSASSRIMWSDYQVANDFTIGPASIAGFIDLDYGDEILNAIEMMGALYIFTSRSIWRCVPNITENSVFSFQKIYSEPKNQTGCLAYPNTLCTDGRQLFWLGRDSIWTFNPYIVAPESPEWLVKASGALFSDTNDDRMEKRCCESIIGEYRPLTKEVWFSYPQGADTAVPVCNNNRSLVLNAEYKTADLVDQGYSALANFSRNATSNEACNVDKLFLGASTVDYTIKSIGDVFYRENVTLIGGVRTADIPDALYATVRVGYFCRVMGQVPLGFPNKIKTIRLLELDAEITPNALPLPNLLTLRIGNSTTLQDPVSTDATCAVQWHQQPELPLHCPDDVTLATMAALGQNPSEPLAWTLYEEANHLYYDIRITGPDGVAAPVEHDAAFSAFRFDVLIS